MKRFRVLSFLIAGVLACSGESEPNPVQEAFFTSSKAMELGAAVAFRFPASGGLAHLYRLPNMAAVSWRFELGPRHPVRMIGFVSDDDLIYALAERDEDDVYDLIALDLVAGRGRTIDTSVTAAVVGPTGVAYVFRPNGTVGQIEHRTADIWPDTLATSVRAIWGAARGRLLAVLDSESSRELLLLARGQPTIRQPLPNGDMAVERWARLVAVVVDSGLITMDPADTTATRFLPISPSPRLVAFSSSGHQIYVVSGNQDLVSIDRFLLTVGRSVRLPGRITAVRVGPLGRRLLAYSADAGTMWVVDLVQLAVEAELRGSWQDDLPAIASDGTVLLRNDGSLVAYSGEDFAETGVGSEGHGDLWLVTQWDPRRPALEFARDSALADEGTSRTVYAQLSSSSNATWALAFAEELSRAGMPISVLHPDSTDELYRVVMGPYSTREEAEASARRLGRPFFIRVIDNPIP